MSQHQISNATSYDRYPNIFKVCLEYFGERNVKIVSWGCSEGIEVVTLRELYFPHSSIYGVDINSEMVELCKSRNNDAKIKFSLTDEFYGEKDEYDLIFCMSVLCRWPETKHIKDCSSEYPFKEFEKQLTILCDYLAPGGLIVIYNANFCFFETEIYSKFTPLTEPRIQESGHVHKFNSKNRKIDINYKDCVFIKKQQH